MTGNTVQVIPLLSGSFRVDHGKPVLFGTGIKAGQIGHPLGIARTTVQRD